LLRDSLKAIFKRKLRFSFSMPIETNQESETSMFEANIDPKWSWLARNILVKPLNSVVSTKVHISPNDPDLVKLMQKSLRDSRIVYSFSHTNYGDPPIAYQAIKELGLPNPYILMTDDLGKGRIRDLLKKVGAVEVNRDIFSNKGDKAERENILKDFNKFLVDSLCEGQDIAFAPTVQRTTDGIIDNALNNRFGGGIPRAMEEFVRKTGQKLTLATVSISYDFTPDAFEQYKRSVSGQHLSRKEMYVFYGLAEHDGEGYKTGAKIALRNLPLRLIYPGSRPCGDVYVNITLQHINPLLEKSRNGKLLIRDVMHNSLKESFAVTPSSIVSYSMLKAGKMSVSKGELEDIVGETVEALYFAHAPLAPTVSYVPSETIGHAKPLLEKNGIISYHRKTYAISQGPEISFVIRFMANLGKYQFDKIK
jgi:hypothetical protein